MTWLFLGWLGASHVAMAIIAWRNLPLAPTRRGGASLEGKVHAA